MTPPTIIQNITHNGHGDIYAQQNAGAQKVDASWLLWPAVIVIGGSAVAGLATGAFAFGAMIAPYVVGGVLAVGGGIGGVKVWQKTLVSRQKLTPAPLLLCPEALEMAARLADRGIALTESDLLACERLAQRIKQCASLPSPSESSPLPASRLAQSS